MELYIAEISKEDISAARTEDLEIVLSCIKEELESRKVSDHLSNNKNQDKLKCKGCIDYRKKLINNANIWKNLNLGEQQLTAKCKVCNNIVKIEEQI